MLVNDFGDINIDLDLIESRTDDTIELSNGCICCSMIDGFSEALDRILEFDPRPDRLVIEASGVADPAGVAAFGHGPGLSLDAVIVLVDTETIRTAADDKYVSQTIRQQLASAEIIVANKADLVDPEQLEATVTWLEQMCPDALVLTAMNSRVEPEVLFGRPSLQPPTPADGHHHPERLFATETVRFDEPITRDRVDELMNQLPATTVRAKGLVHLEGEADPFVLQRVGGRWSLRPSPNPWPREPSTEIVVIAVREG